MFSLAVICLLCFLVLPLVGAAMSAWDEEQDRKATAEFVEWQKRRDDYDGEL